MLIDLSISGFGKEMFLCKVKRTSLIRQQRPFILVMVALAAVRSAQRQSLNM